MLKDTVAVTKYIRGDNAELRALFFKVVPEDKTRSNGVKLQSDKFWTAREKNPDKNKQ